MECIFGAEGSAVNGYRNRLMNTSTNSIDVGANVPALNPHLPHLHIAPPVVSHSKTTPDSKKRSRLKATMLVADSDPTVLAQTIRILTREDFNVFSAVCHASAISAAMKLELDVIVCDLSLWIGAPGKDLVAEIHAIPGRSDVPIVFTSSGQGPDIIRRQHNFGGAYHIKKPYDPEVLLEFVERALWMPHLVKSHIQKPHFATEKKQETSTVAPGIVIGAAEVAFGSSMIENSIAPADAAY